MFKPTPPLLKSLRRLQLTTKQAGHDFYRGTRTGSMGQHTKWGAYKIDWSKVRTYVVPENLADFHLTPFVAGNVEKIKGKFPGLKKGGLSGEHYLARWKEEGAEA